VLTDADRQTIAQTIRASNAGLFATGATNDLEAGMAFWVSDPQAYFVGDEALFLNRIVPLRTKAEIREVFGPALENRNATTYEMVRDHVAVLSLNHAVHVYEAKYAVTDTLGNTGNQYPMTATTIWVRENGEWKILHYHQSWSTEPQQ